ILERNFWLLTSIKIHPDKPIVIHMNMNREQTILALIKPIQLLIPRRLGKLAVKTIRPSMVLARENTRLARFLRHHGKSAVAADVVEGVDISFTILDEDKGETRNGVLEPVASVD